MIQNSKKSVLITGAATRIGRAIALYLARRNWNIALHYHHSEKEALKTQAEILKTGCQAILVSGDLTLESITRQIVDQSREKLNTPLIALINNASLFVEDNILALESSQWDRHMNVNLKAPVFLTKAFAENLPENLKGSVINLIDQRIAKLTPQFFSYTVSKSALATATTTLAQALAPQIRVNAIAPGPTLRNKRQTLKDFTIQKQSTLLEQGSSVEEITKAVDYLLSAQSVTGQTLYVDGGQRLIWKTADIWGVQE